MLRCLNPKCRKMGVEGTTFCTNPTCHCLMPEAIVADRYRVETLIGIGGMGAVYRVSDTFETTQVALKVLSFTYLKADADVAMERFRREARYAHQLVHKNIVPVVNFGSDGDILYLVMPLITGGTIKALLKGDRPLTIGQTKQYLTELASALEAVHSHRLQIVHRDIKPSNLLLHQDDGRLVVTDFGIARAMRQDKPLTQLGWSLGTEHYIAPEQEQGQAEPASDIYAMGVVAYQFMTGLLPFQAIVRTRATELPVPSSINPLLPPAVDAVVLKAIEVNPRNRFQSAKEFSDALNDAFAVGNNLSDAPTLIPPRDSQTIDNVVVRVLIPENPCASCGRENRTNSRFCRYCGHNLDETSQLQMDACEVGYASKRGQQTAHNADTLLAAHGMGINLAPPPHSFGLFAVASNMHDIYSMQVQKEYDAKEDSNKKTSSTKPLDPGHLAIETLVDIVLPLMAPQGQTPSHSGPHYGNTPQLALRQRPPTSILSQWIHDGVQRANQVIYHCSADYETAMGSTMTAALVHNHRLYVAHLGDNRIYHFTTTTGLNYLTNDHTLAGDLVVANLLPHDSIYRSGKRHQYHRYLGNNYIATIDTIQQAVQRDDLIVLCTNGLWNTVRNKQMEDILSLNGDVQFLAYTLTEMAYNNGASEASAIVLRIL